MPFTSTFFMVKAKFCHRKTSKICLIAAQVDMAVFVESRQGQSRHLDFLKMALTRNGLRMLSWCAVLPAHSFSLNQLFLVLDGFDALFTYVYAHRRAERCREGLLMKTNIRDYALHAKK